MVEIGTEDKMKTQQVIELVNQYSEKFRGQNLENFEIGQKYFLFPNSEDEVKSGWPNQWQFCGNAGIYLFIDENDEVIYIGETTHFGNRFGSYFANNDGKCSIKNSWNSAPLSVIPIKVPQESTFERLALEEFLIKKVKTTDNKKFNYNL